MSNRGSGVYRLDWASDRLVAFPTRVSLPTQWKRVGNVTWWQRWDPSSNRGIRFVTDGSSRVWGGSSENRGRCSLKWTDGDIGNGCWHCGESVVQSDSTASDRHRKDGGWRWTSKFPGLRSTCNRVERQQWSEDSEAVQFGLPSEGRRLHLHHVTYDKRIAAKVWVVEDVDYSQRITGVSWWRVTTGSSRCWSLSGTTVRGSKGPTGNGWSVASYVSIILWFHCCFVC
jgi:hypothetical protein